MHVVACPRKRAVIALRGSMRSSLIFTEFETMQQKIIFLTLWLMLGLANASHIFAADLHGKLEQGALVTGKVVPGTRVELDGKPVRVTPRGIFAIGFDRDAKPEAQLTTIATNGERSVQTLSIRQRQYDIQRVTGVPQQTVEPPPEQLQRIVEEQKLVEQARATDSDREDFSGPFVWPLQGPISGVYGSQRFYNGRAGRPHFGVDVAAAVGTAVRAPADATVTLAQPDLFFSGGTLIMDHGYGVSSTFMHLSRLLVKTGDQVRAGQVVAEVGATGRASGPHLDWRINWFNVRLDPQTVVEPMPIAAPASAGPVTEQPVTK
jgi:murein DD-endopeptidase MepM/ murein hydrolase activator NlpD